MKNKGCPGNRKICYATVAIFLLTSFFPAHSSEFFPIEKGVSTSNHLVKNPRSKQPKFYPLRATGRKNIPKPLEGKIDSKRSPFTKASSQIEEDLPDALQAQLIHDIFVSEE